jgi:hypothetical protein
MRGETLYTLAWKRRAAPPIDYSICDAYDGRELYVTSDQTDALIERRKLGKKRDVKLLALIGDRVYQAVFSMAVATRVRFPARRRRQARARERLLGWRHLKTKKSRLTS